jgi:hypothetical protein
MRPGTVSSVPLARLRAGVTIDCVIAFGHVVGVPRAAASGLVERAMGLVSGSWSIRRPVAEIILSVDFGGMMLYAPFTRQSIPVVGGGSRHL